LDRLVAFRGGPEAIGRGRGKRQPADPGTQSAKLIKGKTAWYEPQHRAKAEEIPQRDIEASPDFPSCADHERGAAERLDYFSSSSSEFLLPILIPLGQMVISSFARSPGRARTVYLH
jgi:hypothetical protein